MKTAGYINKGNDCGKPFGSKTRLKVFLAGTLFLAPLIGCKEEPATIESYVTNPTTCSARIEVNGYGHHGEWFDTIESKYSEKFYLTPGSRTVGPGENILSRDFYNSFFPPKETITLDSISNTNGKLVAILAHITRVGKGATSTKIELEENGTVLLGGVSISIEDIDQSGQVRIKIAKIPNGNDGQPNQSSCK